MGAKVAEQGRQETGIFGKLGASVKKAATDKWTAMDEDRRQAAALNLDPPMLLGGSDGECSCGKQGWDCLRFSSAA